MGSQELTQGIDSTLDTPQVARARSAVVQRVTNTVGVWTTGVWGWFPVHSLVVALCLLLIATSNTAARSSAPWAEPVFWGGLIALYAPIFARLAAANVARRERIGLVVLLGLGLYMVKILHSPLYFSFHDEFAHWRTAQDIIETGRLFTGNPIIPASALYPGVEIATSALVKLTGLSIFNAGIIVLGLARLMLVLGLFLFFEQVSRSARVAGIATALYMANPNFVYFLAQFSYESLALPLAVVVLFAAVRRARTHGDGHLGLSFMVMVGLAGVVTTHHLTSFAVVGFLGLWTIVYLYGNRLLRQPAPVEGERMDPGGLALLILVISLAWMVYVASLTLGYLAPVLSGAIIGIVKMIAGDAAGRELFKSSEGTVAPLLERLTAFGSVGLLLLGLMLGLYYIWRTYRTNPIALTLGVAALGYPATLALRFTPRGWEVANRSSEFLFLGVGLVLAIGIVEFLKSGSLQRLRPLHIPALVAYATGIFAGGVIAGWPPNWRQPGPYQPDAVVRSINAQGIQAAEWARDRLGPGHHVGADQASMLMMGSYGEQRIMSTLSGGVDPGWIMFSPFINSVATKTLQSGDVEYLVIDQRLTELPDRAWRYYPDSDMNKAFAKFDRLARVSRVFDNGDIQIYDVGALAREP